MKRSGLVVVVALASGTSAAQAAESCPVTHEALVSVLRQSVQASGGPSNGGFDNHEWASVVDRDGIVCAVAYSGGSWDEQWPGSRILSAEKAGTANAFSVAGKAMATANLYASAQPGGSLSGIVESNERPPEPKSDDTSTFGTAADPMIGRRIGGVVIFGGGLALYDGSGIVGGVGISGDSSCADHNVAWRVRKALGLDKVPAGVSPDAKDAIVYDIGADGRSASGFGHVACVGTEAEVAARIGAGVVAATAAPAAASPPAEDLVKRQEDPGEWVMPGGSYSGQRFSRLKEITAANVGELKEAWSFSTGTLRGHEGQPLVVDATMYLVTPYPNIVYALDLTREGAPIKWIYEPKQDEDVEDVACCDVVNRGLAYADGRIVFNQLDAHTVALDARTGEQLWKVQQGEYRKGETMTAAPMVVGNLVYSGVSGGEFGVRGFLTANDLATGRQIWRAYGTGPDSEVLIGPGFRPFYAKDRGTDLGVTSWGGNKEWQHGGSTAWAWYTYDPALDLIYYGTGNPGVWNADMRPGDNKWSMSIMARNAKTGEAAWAYQKTPHDLWDYDGITENILVELPIGGTTRKVIVNFDKNGFVYTVDRASGEVLSAVKYVNVNWAEEVSLNTGIPKVNPEKATHQGSNVTNICPSAMGGKDQQPAAFSTQTGLFYVPTNNQCMDYRGLEIGYVAGAPYVGADVRQYAGPGGNLGEFMAWDPVAGRRVWGNKETFAVWGGALVTAGDVVFYGTMDGWFKAVDARSGAELWKTKLPSGIIGDPMSYLGPDGRQYIAVFSGVGGWPGLTVAADKKISDTRMYLGGAEAYKDLPMHTRKGGSLHVFALGGAGRS